MNGKNFIVVYQGMYYTKPMWGPTFSPHKKDATLFTEKQAKEVCRDLHDFKGISYQSA
jgi:hypothetical protein